MGSFISTAVEKALGNIVTAPFRSILSKSCEDECGKWDGICFLESACGASMIRLFIAYFLVVITVLYLYLLLFLYLLLWKTGLVKCLSPASSRGFYRTLGSVCGCFWHRLRHTRRVYRGRRARRDVEMAELDRSSSEDESTGSSRKRGRSPVSVRERRKDRMRPTTSSRQTTKSEHPAKRSRTLH